jgi:hypothetical protein
MFIKVMLLRPFLAFIASDRPNSDGYLLAGLMAFASLLQAVVHHQNFLISMRVGWNLRISVTGLLHKKLLRVSQEALGNQDSASVYNLIASDVQVSRCIKIYQHLHSPYAREYTQKNHYKLTTFLLLLMSEHGYVLSYRLFSVSTMLCRCFIWDIGHF